MKRLNINIKTQVTYPNMNTAGAVRAPPNRKNAPGNESIVDEYNDVYIGAYTSGIIASHTPNNELTFPLKL